MLTWRKRNNLRDRYVQNINNINDNIINSKEEKTSITVSIAKLDGGFTESHGETRRQHLHLHLQLRSGQLRNGKRVGAHGNLYLRNGGGFGFLLRIPENRRCSVDSTPTHNTHLCSTVCSQARNAHHALGSSNHGLHFISARLKRICHLVLHMSHPLLFSHLPFTSSTSSSSFTLPSTTTQEQAAQSVQHDQLQEHPVHHVHLQALPVDKLRHQESLWRENVQNDGNPHDNSHRLWAQRACDCLKDRRLFWWSTSIVWCTGKKSRRRSPSSDHGRSEGIWEIGTAGLADSRISETSYVRSQMHFDDSVESIADSDLEDGELQKMLTSPLYALNASGKPDAMVLQEREVSAQCTQADRKESLKSRSFWRSESFGETRCVVFIWAGKPDQEFCVQKR